MITARASGLVTKVYESLYLYGMSSNESQRIQPTWEANFIESMVRLRGARGWRQTDLALMLREKFGLKFHQQTIQRIEDGERAVRLDEAYAIAAFLGSTLEEMSNAEVASNSAQILEFLNTWGRFMQALGDFGVHYSQIQPVLKAVLEGERSMSDMTWSLIDDGDLEAWERTRGLMDELEKLKLDAMVIEPLEGGWAVTRRPSGAVSRTSPSGKKVTKREAADEARRIIKDRHGVDQEA